MNLPKFAIKNHQFTIVIIFLLVLSGIVSFINMPKSEDPTVQPPGCSVIVIYPGANPNDLEQLVVNPLEEAINELEDIKRLNGFAGDGLAAIAVEFFTGSDPNKKYDEVIQKVNSILPQLPENMLSLETMKWTTSDTKILQLALVSETAAHSEMEEIAEELKKNLERISGVKEIELHAIRKQEVRVAIDLKKLAVWNIPLKNILSAIQDASVNIPGGYVDIGTKRLNVKTSGSYNSIDDVRNTIVHSHGGKILYLKDIAEVKMDYEDEKYIARLNGKRCLYITASQKPGTNIFRIFQKIDEEIGAFENTLPSSMKLQSVFDQSESVYDMINTFFMNLLQGIILVGIVIFAAVSFRAASIVLMAIPISIMIAIGAIDFCGYGIQQMTIAGLIVSLGLLVDNAIVVTENISRYIRLGYTRINAAIKGTMEVSWALVSATATTLFSFIPIAMLKGKSGDFMRSMPLTVIFTLTASLLVSLTVTPYLSEKFMKDRARQKESLFRKALNYFIEKYYKRLLNYSLMHPVRTIITALLIFIISLSLTPFIGVSFFPKAEKPQFFMNIDLPPGTSLDKTEDVTSEVEKILSEIPEIKTIASNIGHGNPRLYYNIISSNTRSHHAQIFVKLNTEELAAYNRVINTLRKKITEISGAKIKIKEMEQGTPISADISIRVLGENLSMLEKIAGNVEEIIKSEQGTVNIVNPLSSTKTDLQININRDKAGMLGVPLSEIDRTVRMCLVGLPIAEYHDKGGDSYNIIARLPMGESLGISEFDNIYVSSLTGKTIPLKQLASIELSKSPQTIDHYGRERCVEVLADVERGYNTDVVTKNIIRKIEKYNFPAGYSYTVGGELEEREESFGGLRQAFLIAFIAIFGILVLQFRSYSQPLVVFSAMPLAVIGSILGLLITGNNFSFTAFIGLTSLLGIVVNNSIILVDYINQLRQDGKDIVSALKIAGATRFTPIILTTGTTIGGLLPLTLRGGTLWAPMGWTVIGGLLISTLLTLIIVPVLYKMFTNENEKSGMEVSENF